MKRIPTKGTRGYSLYWNDRYNIEQLDSQLAQYKQLAEDVCTPAERPSCPRWDALFSVYQSLDEAVKMYRSVHQQIDYFEFNK